MIIYSLVFMYNELKILCNIWFVNLWMHQGTILAMMIIKSNYLLNRLSNILDLSIGIVSIARGLKTRGVHKFWNFLFLLVPFLVFNPESKCLNTSLNGEMYHLEWCIVHSMKQIFRVRIMAKIYTWTWW